ncbi:MAG: hypothetical protein ACOX1O_01445 [Eggerthellaceae bacterium]|jgi:hypothetical protein
MAGLNFDEMKKKAQETISQATEQVKPLADAAAVKAQEVADQAKPAVDAAAEKAKPFADAAMEKAQEMADQAKPAVDTAAEKAKPFVDAAAVKAQEWADRMRPAVDDAMAMAQDAASQAHLDEKIAAAQAVAGAAVEGARDKLEEVTGRDLNEDGTIGGVKVADAAAPASEADQTYELPDSERE